MKLFSLFLAASITVGFYTQAEEHTSIKIGSAYPEVSYKAQDVLSNKKMTLDDAATDKGLLVVFSCNTCPFVIKSMPRMEEMLQFAQSKGVGILVLNSNEAQRTDADAPDAMRAFGKEHNYPNYAIDEGSALANAFGANRTPEVFLFNKDKKLVYKGAMDDNVQDPAAAKEIFLKNAIDNMVAGKMITPEETKSIGCTIKRVK